MKKFILLSLCFVALFRGNAQSLEEEILELSKFQILCDESFVKSNFSVISQLGNGNNMTAIQQNSGVASNYSCSQQLGNGNVGYVEQTGDLHIAILNQNGHENEANIWMEGSLTYTQVDQNGNGNIINSYIENQGVLPKGALLLQNGKENKIDFALLGNGCLWNSWPRAALIKQSGSDLEVTALFDSYQCPLYIEQQSGKSGGMSINVSTSDFSFPMKKF